MSSGPAFLSSSLASNDLVFLLAPNHDPFEEGDIIESKPPGFFLEQLHGQLVVYKSGEATLRWRSIKYVDDGSGFSSVASLARDCSFHMSSETFRRQRYQTDSQLWAYPFKYHGSLGCFLAWNTTLNKPVVHQGTIDSPGEVIYLFDDDRRTEISDKTPTDMRFLMKKATRIMQGFMVESQPPGLFLQHDRGELYVYRGMPSEPTSDFLWKCEYAYQFTGDSDLTFTHFGDDGNLVIYGPINGNRHPLWATGSPGRCHGMCFLTWIVSEARLGIFQGDMDSTFQEIWTSFNFRWEEANPGLSVKKQVLVSSLTRFTATCSIIGSGLIVGIIISRWIKNRKVSTTRDRLLLGMSFFDLMASIANVFDVAAIPADTYGIVGAIGNQATCTAQGFFIQFGFGVPLYNCMLCVYTLLIVRMNWTDRFIESRIEPIMHMLAFGYTLTTATLGVIFSLYNSNGSFCWIEMYPHDCADGPHVTCTRGVKAELYQWMFGGVVLISSFVVIIASMSTIYFFIRQNVQQMRERYGDSSVVNNKQLVEVGKQAFLYVAAFMITFIWPMAIITERQLSITPPLWQNALLSFFFTFQGFWNFLIFIRPMYNQLRRRNGEKSCLWVLRTAIVKEATLKRQRSRGGRRNSGSAAQMSNRISSSASSVFQSTRGFFTNNGASSQLNVGEGS